VQDAKASPHVFEILRQWLENESDQPVRTQLADNWQTGIEPLMPAPRSFQTLRCPKPVAAPIRPIAVGARSPDEDEQKRNCIEPAGTDNFLDVSIGSASRLANQLFEALWSGNGSRVQAVLETMVRRSSPAQVFILIRNKLAKDSITPISIDWESGLTSSNRQFLRLKIVSMNDTTKSSGATRITIGSDGFVFATMTERWTSDPLYISVDDALARLRGNIRRRLRDFNKVSQPKKENSPDRAHFRVAGF
jgi:hypothetical protein